MLEPADPRAPTLRYGEPPVAHREKTQVEECGEWLVEVLGEAGEPVKPKGIVKMAEEVGFSRSAVYRARKELEGRVVDTGNGFAPDNRWALASGG